MLQAGRAVYSGYVTAEEGARVILEAALRWLSENMPTRRQTIETMGEREVYDIAYEHAVNDLRRMFLAPEQEYKDGTVIWKEGTTIPLGVWSGGKMYTTNIPTLDTQADNSCPACDHGQSLERGEGTHREGTRQHPVEPEVSPSTELYRAFHRAWSSKVRTEGYNKDDWNKIDSLLNRCLYPSK
jgi:hypothetical protein